MALRQFCQEGNLKWVSLLMWAGANPRSRGPALDDAEHVDDAEWHTTALHEACAFGSVELLKRLRPTRADDLRGMLERAAFSAHREILDYLLDLGAEPNDKPDGGSSALEACIRHLGWEDFDRIRYHYGSHYQTPAYKVPKGRAAIRLLVERGAKWTPEQSSFNDTRRILYRLEPDVAVELIGLLLERDDGEDAARELLRVTRMRQHIASCERQLARLGLTLEWASGAVTRTHYRHPRHTSWRRITGIGFTTKSGQNRRNELRRSTESRTLRCRRCVSSFKFRSHHEGTGPRNRRDSRYHGVQSSRPCAPRAVMPARAVLTCT